MQSIRESAKQTLLKLAEYLLPIARKMFVFNELNFVLELLEPVCRKLLDEACGIVERIQNYSNIDKKWMKRLNNIRAAARIGNLLV